MGLKVLITGKGPCLKILPMGSQHFLDKMGCLENRNKQDIASQLFGWIDARSSQNKAMVLCRGLLNMFWTSEGWRISEKKFEMTVCLHMFLLQTCFNVFWDSPPFCSMKIVWGFMGFPAGRIEVNRVSRPSGVAMAAAANRMFGRSSRSRFPTKPEFGQARHSSFDCSMDRLKFMVL